MVVPDAVPVLSDCGGEEVNGRLIGVDPGEKRIGLAISDPSGTIARPLRVLDHTARMVDAAQIAALAADEDAVGIVVGQALDDEGLPTPEGRKSARLAEAIRSQTNLTVEMWDESFSTQTARQTRIAMGVTRRKRSGHLDELAAAVILQNYLDAHPSAETRAGSA
jgi:putative holliday junction resolvase